MKLSPRQEKIVQYMRLNGTLHNGRYAMKSADAQKYAQFFELTVLQRIGTITYNPEQKYYYVNAAQPTPIVAPPDEMFSGERFGGTTPIRADTQRAARTQYIAARRNTNELRAVVQAQAVSMSPQGLKYLQDSVNCFYEAVEIEARRARELFDLLSDQTYD